MMAGDRRGSPPSDRASSWHPVLVLGEAGTFQPRQREAGRTAAAMRSPRGVWFDDDTLAVADTGHHRILIWHGLPSDDHAPADVVVGDRDRPGDERWALHAPTSVQVTGGRLVVSDAWNHRVLIWNEVPRSSDHGPDVVLGQSDLAGVEPARSGRAGNISLSAPSAAGWIDGWFWIADTAHRRLLGWSRLPDADQPPDVVIGAAAGPSELHPAADPAGAPGGEGFAWPYALATGTNRVYVADPGHHRVLSWASRPGLPRTADRVFGSRDIEATNADPHRAPTAATLRSPYGVAADGDRLAIADSANNRVLIWDDATRVADNDTTADGIATAGPADHVLGQSAMDANGENRFGSVMPDSLSWPHGLWWHGERLAVADSGNDRVVFWQRG